MFIRLSWVAVVILIYINQPASAQLLVSHPLCANPESDSDGDGWGWENDLSCLVSSSGSTTSGSTANNTSSNTDIVPVCTNPESDSDGDGWGWENDLSCLVSSSGSTTSGSSANSTSSNTDILPDCVNPESDSDGIGWGWENNESCIVDPDSIGGSTLTPENSIVEENSRIGTENWRITRSADDLNRQIKGYGSATSVNRGESIDFYITVSPEQIFTIEIYRMGWYGGKGGRLITSIGPVEGVTQPENIADPLTGLITSPWTSDHTLTVPSDWISGVYLAKLVNAAGFENYVGFVVRDDANDSALLYQQPINTYQAYNNFPNDSVSGKSLYNYNSYGLDTISTQSRAVMVSFNRPYSGNGFNEFFKWEFDTIKWLEKSGYDITYSTNTDIHLNGSSLLKYKAIVSAGHDEYWTQEIYDAFEQARDSGTNIAFLGSNAAYWNIRLGDSMGGHSDRTMVSYKRASIDPEPDLLSKTIRFRDIGRPEQTLLGVQYGVFNSWQKNTDYIVENSDHWIYENTGFLDGAVVERIVGYEVDTIHPDYPLPSNTSYTVLASSPFVGANGDIISAKTVLYQAPSGAWVFSSGTMSWSWALAKEGYEDSRIQQTTKNILDMYVTGVVPGTDD